MGFYGFYHYAYGQRGRRHISDSHESACASPVQHTYGYGTDAGGVYTNMYVPISYGTNYNDTIYSSSGAWTQNVSVNGMGGNDLISISGLMVNATLHGNTGYDHIIGDLPMMLFMAMKTMIGWQEV